MANTQLLSFIDAVVCSHELATGLKKLSTHQGIVEYANSKGYAFNNADWSDMFEQDFSLLSKEDQEKVSLASPDHWSWAFRQVSVWRGMLMEGAGDGCS